MLDALKKHWPEYLMEAAELGCFMISASLFAILLFHPSSPAVRTIPSEFVRRMMMGIAMGATAVTIIYSPWGKRSGAHMNPAITLTFFRLGKVAPWDAIFYVIAQFVGGVFGILLVSMTAVRLLADPSINYVATLPGAFGPWAAFAGEVVISFILVSVVLAVSNQEKFARFTGLFAGLCVATFITFEGPISGMSMNPARTFGSALLPHLWSSLWIYFLAPPIGMWLAAAVHLGLKQRVACAKLHHQNSHRCIFCEYQAARIPHAKAAKLARGEGIPG
jgi:aquaporin Z